MTLGHVRFEQTIVAELLSTHRTPVWHFLRMNPLVNSVGLVRFEAFSACFAGKVPLTRMDRRVLDQLTFGRKPLFAKFTLKSQPFVLGNVRSECFIGPQLGSTNGTNEGILRRTTDLFVLIPTLSAGEHFCAALVSALNRPDAVVVVEVELVGFFHCKLLRTVRALDLSALWTMLALLLVRFEGVSWEGIVAVFAELSFLMDFRNCFRIG